ncbi:ADP-ribosylglycohydrolase family protein [Halothermothrix orenii]|uniref:ADP-ribosylation/Crystallin J1 n=1 Tax=Halothermothrix orenii (strain H 168 / OCM 544 / DSM 9562) TaxID=373903 RepID=B8D1Z5_HALOH|nr:ADP-ribosylglycohydrolase family protein [Halothermothrix orenii]ACL69222.1 ADP-ribosylation/Crystallin J1 [Halothermothrix orenii H 168]
MKITWIKPEDKIEYELEQSRQEGKDISTIQNKWKILKEEISDTKLLRQKALNLLDEIDSLPYETDLYKEEPVRLIEIKEKSKQLDYSNRLSLDEEELFDKILGGWLGRTAGCLLGKPVEKITRYGIREILESIDSWPLNDYFTACGVPDELLTKYPWNRHGGKESLKENIVCMPEDDDLNYTMLNLHIAETYGFDFTVDNIAEAWLHSLPVMTVFTAERVAYFNCLNLINPAEVATHHNPYREWIGAQIRADLWGWMAAGNPVKAAELAYRDGSFTHVKNGVYGEMFVAATIAASFLTDNPLDAVKMGLAVIPQKSRLARAIRFAINLPRKTEDWGEAVDILYKKYGHYHWVHTINNAALLTAAIVYGKGNYEKTICLAVMGGWDTDCNGATVGSILGTLLGAKRLPDKWIKPLNNRIRSSLKGFDNVRIDELAKRTFNLVDQ